MSDAAGRMLARLEAFEIDLASGGDAPAFTFTARLARENGWSEAFAARVVGEYKRFVVLCLEAGHPCTPSEHVDQAWHLHLTYTESYWERMCGEVLGRPLHHRPTRGGDTERGKFDDWYGRTLESYARLFGETPPSDVWPDAATRFGDDLRWERVNLAEHVVLPRRAVRRWVCVGGGVAAGLAIGAAVWASAWAAAQSPMPGSPAVPGGHSIAATRGGPSAGTYRLAWVLGVGVPVLIGVQTLIATWLGHRSAFRRRRRRVSIGRGVIGAGVAMVGMGALGWTGVIGSISAVGLGQPLVIGGVLILMAGAAYGGKRENDPGGAGGCGAGGGDGGCGGCGGCGG